MKRGKKGGSCEKENKREERVKSSREQRNIKRNVCEQVREEKRLLDSLSIASKRITVENTPGGEIKELSVLEWVVSFLLPWHGRDTE